MELCKKVAPAQADCNWDLQAMTLLQVSIKLLWWQPVNNWFVRVVVGACEVIAKVLWLQNVWFSYHPCSEGQLEERTVPLPPSLGAGDGIYKCSIPVWTAAVLHRLCGQITVKEKHHREWLIWPGGQNQLLLYEQFQVCPACPQLPVSFLVNPQTYPWPWQRAPFWVMPEHGQSSVAGLLGRMRPFFSIDVSNSVPVGLYTWEHS